MKIAILGAGNIGGTLGGKWLAAGHEVAFGVRDANSPKTLSALGKAKDARVMSVKDAIQFGEVVLFSVPWNIVPAITKENASVLDGKVLIDATNNFAGPIINNLAALSEAASHSLIYRAFNSLGWELFAEPVIAGQQVDMFYCGPDGETRIVIHTLIEEIGLNPIWAGDNNRIHLVDNLGALWVNMIFQRGWKRRFAFKAMTE